MTDLSAARRDRLRTLALAAPDELAARWEAFADMPGYRVVKGPETGLVMVRGRTGGGGAPFNVGEATVTRCVVALDSGELGFGHVLGRDPAQAERIAVFDALGETAAGERVAAEVIAPLDEARDAADATRAAEVAATRVDFFTLARGD